MKKIIIMFVLICSGLIISSQCKARTFFGKISTMTYNIKNNDEKFLTGDEDRYAMLQKGKWRVAKSAKFKDGDLKYNLYVNFSVKNTSWRDLNNPVRIVGYNKKKYELFSLGSGQQGKKKAPVQGRSTAYHHMKPIEISSQIARDLHEVEVEMYPRSNWADYESLSNHTDTYRY
jgi:hypothetical protein